MGVDEKLDQLRHKELITAINSLKSVLSKPEPKLHDNGTKESIDKLCELLSKMPKPEAPIVNITQKNDELHAIMGRIESSMNKPEKEPVQETKEWHHKVVRDQNGFIDHVISKKK